VQKTACDTGENTGGGIQAMSQQKKQTYTIVDLFAGAGGLSYGFLQTERYKVAAAFELNQNAQTTYLKNHGKEVSMYSDVDDALSVETKEKLGRVDVIIGGPPCQGFSNANRQKNHAISQNNSLVKKFVQAVLHLGPMAFVMENVSMLQSNIHRFFVDADDQGWIAEYSIPTEQTEIPLLEENFLFDGACDIVKDLDKIENYLWDENDYLVLNVVYKMRKNAAKLQSSLKKHQRRLLSLSTNLFEQKNENNHIIHQESLAAEAIQRYYNGEQTEISAIDLCAVIEPTVMYQRMLSKAKELHDNHIVVSEYTENRGLTAKVTSMAVIDYIEKILGSENNGYSITKGVLSAATFGAPQKRMRFVVMGVKQNKKEKITLPEGTFTEATFRTVEDALSDIENVEVKYDVNDGNMGITIEPHIGEISDLGTCLRDTDILYNHVSTATTPTALERFKAIKQGDNFHSLLPELKTTYSDVERTQNTIYLRLKYDEPSGTVVNVRKSMWIHPIHDRALSVREAARLQTFPDSFIFCGTKDSQYQQVGNAVPPILAKAIAEHLVGYLDKVNEHG
jgi:DNA (cytosine-5)-methyltransferase 1